MNIQNESEAFILFEVNQTTYGVRSRYVQQIEMVEQVTAVPNAPPAIEGVVFTRGQVVPALNLRPRFGFEKTPFDLRSRLIVVNNGSRVVGMIVDTAREFLNIPSAAIGPPPESLTGLSGNYLEGVATLNNRLILILNLDEVIDVGNLPAANEIRSN
jgi:purine-binding chemotaxis protein CheW